MPAIFEHWIAKKVNKAPSVRVIVNSSISKLVSTMRRRREIDILEVQER